MRINIKTCLLLVLLLGAVPCPAGDLPPWHTARQTILGCYGGWDVEVTLSAGYEQRTYYDGPVDGPFANGTISVPIYSRKQRLERQEHTNSQVEHLAELYAEYQGQSAILAALEQEKQVLKRTMLDDGATGITAYFSLIKEVEQSRSKRDGAERKIINWLELCGYRKTEHRKQKTGKDEQRTGSVTKDVATNRIAGTGLPAR